MCIEKNTAEQRVGDRLGVVAIPNKLVESLTEKAAPEKMDREFKLAKFRPLCVLSF